MPTLRRDDGIQFVIQSYRELLLGKRPSVLKRKIRSLAIKHGEYVRLFKQDVGRFDIVFSREPGYLLGETIWHYFGKPANMIFCEALPEKNQALLVIVRSSSVYLDTRTSFGNLIDEFASLALSNEKYIIYTYGNVPLSETRSEECFAFEKNQVESFTHLTEPTFQKLIADPELQLQPLELALTSPHLNIPLTKPIAIGVAILFIIFFWVHFSSSTPTQRASATQLIPLVDPYGSFNEALSSPNPGNIITELNNIITTVYTLPGWQALDLNYNYKDNYFTVTLQRIGGQTAELQTWSAIHNASLQMSNNGATLKFKVTAASRQIPKLIYSMAQLLPLVIDQLSSAVTRESINSGNISQSGATKYANLSINFDSFAPSILDLIGKILNKFPVQLTALTIRMQNNLLSGNLQLNVWGN